MALPMIETGYKPEFGLGAVYQGFNAANADMSAQEEIIKQFLANQREQQMQPMDVGIKQNDLLKSNLEGQQAQIQNNPNMLQRFLQNKEAGYNKAIREDEVGQAMQPYELQAAPMLGQKKVADSDIMNQVALIETQLAQTQNPVERMALTNKRNQLVGTHGYTPEHWGKVNVENVKGGWDYDKAIDVANINASATRDAANARGKAGADVAAKLAMDATKEINVLEAQHAKLQSKEGEIEFSQNFLGVPPEKRTALYRQAVQESQAKLQEARARRDHFVSQTSVSLPPQAQPQAPQQASLQKQVEGAGIKYEPNTYDYRVVDGKVQRKKKE